MRCALPIVLGLSLKQNTTRYAGGILLQTVDKIGCKLKVATDFCINVFRLLRTQSVRNKKPPALRVGNKRLYQNGVV